MINVIKQEIDMEESLRKRLEIICDFCNATPTLNEFFKYLLPQLLSYFGTQKLVLEDFIPKVIENHYGNLLLPYEPNNKENMENKDDEINE